MTQHYDRSFFVMTHSHFFYIKKESINFAYYRQKEENFDADTLNEKIGAFTRATGQFKEYTVSQKGLSMTDM